MKCRIRPPLPLNGLKPWYHWLLSVAVAKRSTTGTATAATTEAPIINFKGLEKRIMNQIKIMGIANAGSEFIKHCSPSEFSDELYDGVSLYRRRDNKPVVLFMSKTADPARWKVLDGASEFYFRSFTKATDFCQMRGYLFVKGGNEQRT